MNEAFRGKRILEKSYIAGAVVAVVGGILCWKSHRSPIREWPWLLSGLVGLTAWMTLGEAMRRRHRTIIQGRRLRWLTELGFSAENIGDYWGYKGVYRSYFIRIFYNWDTNLYRRDQELCLMAYFQPPLLPDGKLDIAFLTGPKPRCGRGRSATALAGWGSKPPTSPTTRR